MGMPKVLKREKAALVIIDFQEAFRKAIPDFEVIGSRIATIARGFAILGRPVYLTEQYPAGLGHTAEEVMLSCPENRRVFEKTRFGAGRESGLLAAIEIDGVTQLVICGIEAHICVNQTAHDFLAAGFDVHLLRDAVSSRFEADKMIGVDKMLASGAVSASIESALFKMVEDSRDPLFRPIQELIK